MLYDVSSSYYERESCPLIQFGRNRDGRWDWPMVVYRVLADAIGRPPAVDACASNTRDSATVRDQVEKMWGRFGLDRAVSVGDGGLLTKNQINHLKRHLRVGWISALRHRQIHRLMESEANQLSLFYERYLPAVHSPEFPGEWLIACHNPILAFHRWQKREALLKATKKTMAGIAHQLARRTEAITREAQLDGYICSGRADQLIGSRRLPWYVTIRI